jgi:gliding motility-associated-like protein
LAKLAPYNLAYTDEIELNRSDDYCYKVIAYANDTTHLYSESNIDCISTKPRLFAPNVFTVNQDGLNETFRLGGYFIETFYIEIYNRLGERIFESNDITNSWDGTFNNIPCASDVYVYIAKATGYNGDKIEIKGNVTLLR